MKKLLYALATSVPFTPNISKLSEKIGVSRPFMSKALYLLEKAQLLKLAHKSKTGMVYLNKPDKTYLHNTNLIIAIGEQNANSGNLRETFFMNQLSINHHVSLPDMGDFEVDHSWIFEVGGKNKTRKQIKNKPEAYIVQDTIEYGFRKTIPLWLFGFCY